MSEIIRAILHLPEAASTFARGLDLLHFTIMALTLIGAVGVTVATVGFVVRHHETGGARRGAPRGIARKVEYTLLSGLLALFFALWVVGYRQYVAMATPPSDTFDVYVIGKQWMWSFAYADGGASNHDLYVPVGRPVRLMLTSRDVIHSFFVPAMRIKQDAVPGRMTIAWFEAVKPGRYEVLCAEFCGLSHSHMRGNVVVLPVDAYEAYRRTHWDAPGSSPAQAPIAGDALPAPARDAPENLVATGRRIAAERGCLRCHTLDGTPHLGPSFAGLDMATVPLEGGGSAVADAAYLTRAMMDPTADVHAGFAPIMPSYMGLLDAPEVAALVALIRSLREVTRGDGREVPLPASADGGVPLPEVGDPRMPAPPSPEDGR